MKLLTKFIVAFLFINPSFADETKTNQIGEVLGKPIYRHQISAKEGYKLYSELQGLFARPIFKQYYESHKDELEPKEWEIEKFTAYYDKKHKVEIEKRIDEINNKIMKIKTKLANKKLSSDERQELEIDLEVLEIELQPPGRDFAMFVLPHRKLQLHFYKNFGGGRLLWQQRGIEAFDAMHNWLKQNEKEGNFKITDSKLREVFYSYWTTMDHGSFFIEDKTRIDQEFLHPEWEN